MVCNQTLEKWEIKDSYWERTWRVAVPVNHNDKSCNSEIFATQYEGGTKECSLPTHSKEEQINQIFFLILDWMQKKSDQERMLL